MKKPQELGATTNKAKTNIVEHQVQIKRGWKEKETNESLRHWDPHSRSRPQRGGFCRCWWFSQAMAEQRRRVRLLRYLRFHASLRRQLEAALDLAPPARAAPISRRPSPWLWGGQNSSSQDRIWEMGKLEDEREREGFRNFEIGKPSEEETRSENGNLFWCRNSQWWLISVTSAESDLVM